MQNLNDFKARCTPGSLLKIKRFSVSGGSSYNGIYRVGTENEKNETGILIYLEDGTPGYFAWGDEKNWKFTENSATLLFGQGENAIPLMECTFVDNSKEESNE